MTGVELLLGSLSVIFALNMGGSGLAPSFSVALGARLLTWRRAALLYGLAVMSGAVVLGDRVAKTLSGGIVPEAALSPERVVCVVGSASFALGLANLLKIPQSTSWVTVLALVGLGIQLDALDSEVLLTRLLPAWVLLPVAAFMLTHLIMGQWYPLRLGNMRWHEHLQRHGLVLRRLVVVMACYVAVAIGSNNVANVAGPLAASGLVSLPIALLGLAPMFGLGALLFPGPARTVGEAIVPLGVLAASVVSGVVGTLLFVATYLGIPQSLVQLNAAAVLAVWHVKEREQPLVKHRLARRMLLLWLFTPLIAAVLTALTAAMFG